MSYVIVVEGPNGTGKTSLITKMFEKLVFKKYEVEYCRTTWKNYKERYHNILAIDDSEIKNNNSKVYIFDRLHWGGMVYGPIKRDGSDMTVEQFRNFENLLEIKFNSDTYLKPKLLMVYCTLPLETVIENQKLNKEEYIKPEEIQQELSLFNRVALNSKLCTYVYNYEIDKDKDKFIDGIFNKMEIK